MQPITKKELDIMYGLSKIGNHEDLLQRCNFTIKLLAGWLNGIAEGTGVDVDWPLVEQLSDWKPICQVSGCDMYAVWCVPKQDGPKLCAVHAEGARWYRDNTNH